MIGSWDRVPDHRYGEAISRARSRFPARIRPLIAHVRFLCGVDPVFAGLHDYETAKDGRSYGETAHCAWRTHIKRPASERCTTIVLPKPEPVYIIVHELAHALDERLGFPLPNVVPTTEYAKVDRWEAFAEAFVSWRYVYGDQDAASSDHRTLALFEGLAA